MSAPNNARTGILCLHCGREYEAIPADDLCASCGRPEVRDLSTTPAAEVLAAISTPPSRKENAGRDIKDVIVGLAVVAVLAVGLLLYRLIVPATQTYEHELTFTYDAPPNRVAVRSAVGAYADTIWSSSEAIKACVVKPGPPEGGRARYPDEHFRVRLRVTPGPTIDSVDVESETFSAPTKNCLSKVIRSWRPAAARALGPVQIALPYTVKYWGTGPVLTFPRQYHILPEP